MGSALSQISGSRKAAILLSLLGDESAATILRNLSDKDLQRITDEVANLDEVPFDVSLQVLEQYRHMVTAQEFVTVGGREVADRFLVKAFGENGAKAIVHRLAEAEDSLAEELNRLKKADPKNLARHLAGERLQTQALVLGNLDAKQASAVLMSLEPEVRTECVRRLASLRQCSPEITGKVSAALNRRLRSTAGPSAQSDSGFRSAAELMNSVQATAARDILDEIGRQEPNLAINIRDLMFRFDDFLEVPERELRELMNSIDKKTLMVSLKTASEDLKSHFFRTMSSRAVEMMKEDSEMMGPVRSKDIASAQAEIVAIARKLEADGKITLRGDGDDEYVV
jgi:flagellar motor switch protein FliG